MNFPFAVGDTLRDTERDEKVTVTEIDHDHPHGDEVVYLDGEGFPLREIQTSVDHGVLEV